MPQLLFFLFEVRICTYPVGSSRAVPLSPRVHLMSSSSESYLPALRTLIDVEAVESHREDRNLWNECIEEASLGLSSFSSQHSIHASLPPSVIW